MRDSGTDTERGPGHGSTDGIGSATSERGQSTVETDGGGDLADAVPGLPREDDLDAIREALIGWYEQDHRSFPWRQTTDPYEVLVCEVMSQQTQLTRVQDAWTAFLDRWPTVEALADADRSEVVKFWSEHSLGYNNRARYLHEAAQLVTNDRDGEVPRTVEKLEELPGVGPYTATAVASFAFEVDEAVVDTNVRRILHRAFDVPDSEAAFERTADELLPADASRIWNNAIMELGGVACSKTPRCDEANCPWRPWCRAYATGDFTAPDVPSQPAFEGSHRQMRGRVVAALGEHGELELDVLGRRVRVDYAADGEYDQSWLRDLLEDLAEDGLVAVDEAGPVTARLQR